VRRRDSGRFTFPLRAPDRELIPVADDLDVWKTLLGVAAAALVSAAAAAAGGGAALPAGWTHAEINFSVDRVPHTLVLDRGRIIDQGTHTELLTRGGLYANLYEHQFRTAPYAAATLT
jgi:hypothetical protein